MNLVFLLEERSMKVFLDELLPRVLPPEITFQTIPHEGKSDLEKSIPRKLRAWRTPDTRFVVVRDQDAADCHRVKEELTRLCTEAGRPDTLARVACRELEAWILGDLDTVAELYQDRTLTRQAVRKRLRDPDRISKPSRELKRLVPAYQKVAGARAVGGAIDIEGCRSRSFRVFVEGVRRLAEVA